MAQKALLLIDGDLVTLDLPSPETNVVAGVPWGRFDHLFTPAYWRVRAEMADRSGWYRVHKIGTSLRDEVAVCLLGGYGMRAEVGLSAFTHLKRHGLLSAAANEHELELALREPMLIGKKAIRYRYPRQKARYLRNALRKLETEPTPSETSDFRAWLMTFDGIGPKTASWITRNYMSSDSVAILDIHVFRACVLTGLFKASDSVATGYFRLEKRLVQFAANLGVKLSVLDAILWDEMRQMSAVAINAMSRGGNPIRPHSSP
ncbi:MAG TPA: hypothetical protein VG796_14720 [Verrucomicrobiales bacterium]|nr:hypothetical protein [Verrucomicrobiales bacterium]